MTTPAYAYPNVDATITGLKQGVDQMAPIIPVLPSGVSFALLATDRVVLKIVSVRERPAPYNDVVFEEAFTLTTDGSTADKTIVINVDTQQLELYFAKARSLALGQSPGMKPFALYGTLYLEDAEGRSKASIDLYMPMEASF